MSKFDPYNPPRDPQGRPTRAALAIEPALWKFACRQCNSIIETDSEYLRSIELCGLCLDDYKREMLTDLERDEREEER